MEIQSYVDLTGRLTRSQANARRWLVKRPLSDIHYFYVHTPAALAPAPNQAAEFQQLESYARYHISKDWSADGSGVYGWAIMYTWAIGPSGTAYLLNPPEDVLWNTSLGNGVGAATLVLTGDNQAMTPECEATLRNHLLYQASLGYSTASAKSSFGHGECGLEYGGGPDFQNNTQCPGSVVLAWTRKFRKGVPMPKPGPTRRLFLETGKSLQGAFLDYWTNNDGMVQFGFPLTEEIAETIGTWSGTVQYFERARLEWHVETEPGQVMLGRIGAELLSAKHFPGPGNPAPGASH